MSGMVFALGARDRARRRLEVDRPGSTGAMARVTDVALLGPRLVLGATRTFVKLVPRVASAAGELAGSVLGNGARPHDEPSTPPGQAYPDPAREEQGRPAPERSEPDRDRATARERDANEADADGATEPDAEPEVPEVRSTVPQAVGGGFPEPAGKDPGDVSGDPSPHHSLSTPVGDPDPTEWPDPYERREDPRDPADPDGEPFGEEPHPHVGSTSTSDPHPTADIEAPDANPPQRDRLDD